MDMGQALGGWGAPIGSESLEVVPGDRCGGSVLDACVDVDPTKTTLRARSRLRRLGATVACAAAVVVAPVLCFGLSAALTVNDTGEADGVPIGPDQARALYEKIADLPASSDGCRLERFDTQRTAVVLRIRGANGIGYELRFAAASERTGEPAAGRRIGGWHVIAARGLDRACSDTVSALESVLRQSDLPQRSLFAPGGRWQHLQGDFAFVAGLFLLLVLASIWVACREVWNHRSLLPFVAALLMVSIVGLALRMWVSPHTFLHEYYHIAETIGSYLIEDGNPTYGRGGPAMFRLAAALLNKPGSVDLIFWVNALLSTLAIPAIACAALAITKRRSHALGSALYLCALPHHLRFSSSEILFVPAVTFALWSLALIALYLRSGRLVDVLSGVVALALAVRCRPEMVVFPGLLIVLVVVMGPGKWRRLFEWRTLLAFVVLCALSVTRLFELSHVAGSGPSPSLIGWGRYVDQLILGFPDVTPSVYLILLLAGGGWLIRNKPGLLVWVIVLFFGYTFSSLSLFSNPQYSLRAQFLPNSFTPLVAGAALAALVDLLGNRQKRALVGVATVAMILAVSMVASAYPFITELRDQQLEFDFLDRTVPHLPEKGVLLAAVRGGGDQLNAFPEFLLQRDGKRIEVQDVRSLGQGAVALPIESGEVLYYQGMYCYFAFRDEPTPNPIAAPCQNVHHRFRLEPLHIVDLHTKGYSLLRYANNGNGPYRIGFYRVRGLGKKASADTDVDLR